MICKHVIRFVALAFVCPQLIAQTPDWQTEWTSQVHELWETVDLNPNINLSHASSNELQSLGLSETQATCLIKHQQIYGPIAHVTELQQCQIAISQIQPIRHQIDPIRQHTLKSFLLSPDSQKWKPTIKTLSNILTGPNQNGFGYVQQVQALWGNWSRLNLLTHSDPGERFNDHFSAALEWKGLGKLEKLVIGKYQWHWNQGLLMMAPYAVGRTFQMGSWVHQQQQLRGAVSTNEDLGLWGIAAHIHTNWGHWYLSIGRNSIDTRIEGVGFSKRQYGGIHLSALELDRRHNNILSQQFLAWNTQLGTFQLNASHARYQYQIPKISSQGLKHLEHYTEIQLSSESLWRARSILNLATEGFQTWSYYVASLWSLGPKIDFALKSQFIPEPFLAPEQSPFTLSDVGKQIHEWGLDYQYGKNHLVQCRSRHDTQEDSLYIDRTPFEGAQNIWQFQYTYRIDKTQYLSARMQLPYSETQANWRLLIQSKFTLLPKLQFQAHYSLQATEIDRSSMVLCQLKWQILPQWHIQTYMGTFEGNEIHYLPLPSAQFPWRLGIFSGKGQTFGIIANFRLTKHLKWRFSVEQIQKTNLIGQLEHQKPRIFVQLEIL